MTGSKCAFNRAGIHHEHSKSRDYRGRPVRVRLSGLLWYCAVNHTTATRCSAVRVVPALVFRVVRCASVDCVDPKSKIRQHQNGSLVVALSAV